LAKKKADAQNEGKRRIATQSPQGPKENQREESVRDEARGLVGFIEGVLYL
jgi:hypothetical protein